VTHPLTTELHTARTMYAGATRLAHKARALMLELQTKCVWLPKGKTVRTVATDIWYDAGYDANERYDSIDEFAEALLEDLLERFEVDTVCGEAAFKVMPFFAEDSAFLHNLGLSSLSPVKLSEFEGLNVMPFEVPALENIAGTTDVEMLELVAMYRRKTLKLVNLLRNLRTAMHYVEPALSERGSAYRTYADTLKADEAAGCVIALVNACELPFEPAPSRYFGTDVPRINVLKGLEHVAGKAFLLEAAAG